MATEYSQPALFALLPRRRGKTQRPRREPMMFHFLAGITVHCFHFSLSTTIAR